MKNKQMRTIWTVLLLCCVALLSCRSENPVETLTICKNTGDGSQITLKCELAITSESQQKGFMQRKNIPAGTGMLFVFNRDQLMHFWMKNTPTALSIAYIDSKGIIREMHDMTPYSEATVSSLRSLRFALEVPQGWFDANGIKTGDSIIISPVVSKAANIAN